MASVILGDKTASIKALVYDVQFGDAAPQLRGADSRLHSKKKVLSF